MFFFKCCSSWCPLAENSSEQNFCNRTNDGMNEGLVEKLDLIGPKDQLDFRLNQCLKNLKKTIQQKKDFFKYWSPSHGNNGFKKI